MNNSLPVKPAAVAAALALLLLAACARPSGPATTAINGRTMGTTYHIKVWASTDQNRLQAAVEKTLARINGRMSTFDPGSEVSRFNRSQQTDWFTVSPETMTVLRAAMAVGRASHGAFDITVAPLVNLWGFGTTGRRETSPPAAEIAARKKMVGLDMISLDPGQPRLKKKAPGVTIDLSAIAKGYAVDAVAGQLDDMGFSSYLVEIGGEVRTRGRKADGRPWTVAIEQPDPGRRAIALAIGLTDRALATSGTYRNFFVNNQRRYSHTIDPRTGAPVTHRLVSVSVAAPSCMVADAWATALMVLGPEQGRAAADRRGLAALFFIHTDNGIQQERSQAWNFSSP